MHGVSLPSAGQRLQGAALYSFILSILLACNALGCYELTANTGSAEEIALLRNFSQVLKCDGVSGLLVVPYLWQPVSVTVDCGKLQSVGTGPRFGVVEKSRLMAAARATSPSQQFLNYAVCSIHGVKLR